MATIAVPLVFMIVGALIYALASKPQVARMGELAFFAGIFWLVHELSGHAFHF